MSRGLIYLMLTIILAACTYTKPITDGSTAFKQHEYATAIPFLRKEYGKSKQFEEKAKLAYMLAQAYKQVDQLENSLQWYETTINTGFIPKSAFEYAEVLQELERYDLAMKAYKDAGRNIGNHNAYLEYIQACRKAKEWIKTQNKNEYIIESNTLNTSAVEFGAFPLSKESMIFSSDRKLGSKADKRLYKWNNRPFFNLFEIDTKSKEVKPFDALTDNNHQGSISMNASQDKVFYCNCGSDAKFGVDYCSIWSSNKENGVWSSASPVILGPSDANYIHPHISSDGKTLYFSSDKPNGYGGYDIYNVSWADSSQSWVQLNNLGRLVNTEKNDVYPFTELDTLYFSSNGHKGMGGLDIYRAEKQSKYWGNVKNLEAPLNSGRDDFGFILDTYQMKADTVLQIGYISSNRKGGEGKDDIYNFVKRILPAPDTIPLDTPIIASKIFLEGLVLEKIYETPGNPATRLINTNPIEGAKIFVLTKDTAFSIFSNQSGAFGFPLAEETAYILSASRSGYLNGKVNLSTKNLVLPNSGKDTTLYTKLYLDKKLINQEIKLEGIYYDYDKSFIRDDAKPILDRLITILKDNPDIRIRLASHTDCRGAKPYNERLSQRRAEAAVAYLIEKGINPTRLEAKGYGETIPSNDCACLRCSKEDHQENRRTTFTILN